MTKCTNRRPLSVFLISNDPPHCMERSYGGLQCANSLVRDENHTVPVFPMGAAARWGVGDQTNPKRYYSTGDRA